MTLIGLIITGGSTGGRGGGIFNAGTLSVTNSSVISDNVAEGGCGAAGLLAQRFYETIRLLAAEWCKVPLKLILPHTEVGILGDVTQYILENIGEPLTIQAVAQIHRVSGRTRMRLFRGQLGTTFGAHLRVARIVKAVELLTAPSVSIIEVAYDVGYNSPSSFSQAFRRLTGMSPQAFVKSLIRVH